jgi:branched-chain amino acid transport system permease protein
MDLASLLQFAISGLTVGATYGLTALGFTIIFNTTGVINFAQGEFVMLGGMMSVFAMRALGLPEPAAVALAGPPPLIGGAEGELGEFSKCTRRA